MVMPGGMAEDEEVMTVMMMPPGTKEGKEVVKVMMLGNLANREARETGRT